MSKEKLEEKTIECSCGKHHEIKDLTAIQTHWYEQPHSCYEGDVWHEGELQFICPDTQIRNRLLFDNYNIPYEERDKFENNPEEQFKRKYKPIFKEVIKEHDEDSNYGILARKDTANNYFVDKNREKFGLVKKE